MGPRKTAGSQASANIRHSKIYMLCIQPFKVTFVICINVTANLEEPQCMPIMLTLVNLFYLSLMTDTLQVMLRKMETLEENQREALLFRRLQGRHTEEVPVMDLQVAQTQAELQDLEECLKVLELRMKVVSV